MLPQHTEVLVVGAGPTGLALALALRASGHEVVVVDRAARGASTSRAAVVHARTLEVLAPLDVTPRLLADGVVVPTFTVRDGRSVLARIDFSGLGTPWPFTLMLPQSRTEEILAARLAELGGVVHREHEVVSVDQDGRGARADVRFPSGEVVRLGAAYVVGADGQHSGVRESAGIAFEGGEYAESFVLADVRMRWPLPRQEVQLFLAPDGLVVVAPLPDDRFRVVATMSDAPEVPSTHDVQRLLDARGPGRADVEDVVWSSRFRVHHRVAQRFHDGRLLLAGDAAHVHSPAGGQGMNTGIQDAVAAARRLGEALAGGTAHGPLAAYDVERRAVARDVVRLTDRATRMATLRGPGARTARNLAIGTLTRVPAMNHRLARSIAGLGRESG